MQQDFSPVEGKSSQDENILLQCTMACPDRTENNRQELPRDAKEPDRKSHIIFRRIYTELIMHGVFPPPELSNHILVGMTSAQIYTGIGAGRDPKVNKLIYTHS